MTDSSQPFILIVDDNTTNLSVLSQTLKAANYKVRIAVDGKDALAQVQRNRPEVILLDIEMPEMDGFETCRQLQANPETQRIPIIFMTALNDTDNKVKGLSLGAVDYITKPFAEAEVLARVNVHWRLKHLTDSLEQQVEERTQALQQMQIQLVQQEKLSTLGQLVAGVAHEINNPMSCILSNVSAAQEYASELFGLIDLYARYFPEPGEEIIKEVEELDLDFIREDLVKLFRAMQDGSNRIANISRSLRTFYRTELNDKQPFDLHEGLDSTLLILRHRLKGNDGCPPIEVIKNYGELPPVSCFPGLLNQVFMNILANAIDALEEKANSASAVATNGQAAAALYKITIQTRVEDEEVAIAIADTGLGIPNEVQQKIFEQGFTTKSATKGTGLGLAIAREIIIEKHQGILKIESDPKAGTTFKISLPAC